MVQVGLFQRKDLVIAKKIIMYDIMDNENLWRLGQMIASEFSGLPEAHPNKEDIELARIVASFIKKALYDTRPGCIIRGDDCE